MKPVGAITGTMAPLPRSNVDTDQIMPKQFLKRVERSGYGQFLFHDWARTSDGELDPDFVLNRPERRHSPCTGERSQLRFRVVARTRPVGHPGLGVRSGRGALVRRHLLQQLHQDRPPTGEASGERGGTANRARHLRPDAVVTIDLAGQTVEAGDLRAGFEIDPFTKYRLLEGLDDIGLTLRHTRSIDSFEAARPAHLPSLG